jgi:hypothetical protein
VTVLYPDCSTAALPVKVDAPIATIGTSKSRMLSEEVIKANIKSLTNAIEQNSYRLTHCNVKSTQLEFTTVVIWYKNEALVPGMSFTSRMMIDICADGKNSKYSVPKKLEAVIEKWIDDLLSKERQQERSQRYKLELLLASISV